jgi:glycolate oxidase iron-sulfur subunit
VVAVQGQVCCGALHLHTGDVEGARDLARANIRAFEADNFDAIIINAAGCGSALKGYGELLRDDPAYADRARAFASRVRDISEYLAGLPLRPPSQALDLTVTYQEPCHLAHAQRIRQQPRRVLAAIPGLRLVEMAEASLCCGSAGIYNVTQPDMAESLLRRKVRNILETGADIVITANPGCFLQVQAGLRDAGSGIRVMHIVDLLAAAYGAPTDRATE